MTVYHVRNWHRYQRNALRSILKSRRARAVRAIRDGEEPERIDRRISLTTISVSTDLSEDVARLHEALGRDGRWADALILRTLQFVAQTNALRGEFYVSPGRPRGHLGVTPGSLLGVSRRLAGRAFEALLGTGFLVEGPAPLPKWARELMDEDTLNEDASRSERGSKRRSEHVPNAVRHSRGRDTGDGSPPYPPAVGGTDRGAPAAAFAGAAGGTGTNGIREVRIVEHIRNFEIRNDDPPELVQRVRDGEDVWRTGCGSTKRIEELHTGAVYRHLSRTDGTSSELRARGREPKELGLPPVEPDVDRRWEETMAKVAQIRKGAQA